MASNTPSNNRPTQRPTPSSILIIGAGVFGLSTTLSLLSNPRYATTHLTLLDPSLPPFPPTTFPKTPTSPSPTSPPPPPTPSSLDSSRIIRPDYALPPFPPTTSPPSSTTTSPPPTPSSLDSSRIIRPDYALPPYAHLALLAQQKWRHGYGGPGLYHESGMELRGSGYVERARENARGLGYVVEELDGGEGGGYVNRGAGWVQARGAVGGVWGMVGRRGREREREGGVVRFLRGRVRELVVVAEEEEEEGGKKKSRVIGAVLESGDVVRAQLTILATGAWTGRLVDLRGRVEATGQIVAYVPVSAEEAARLMGMRVVLDMGSGLFVMPPVWDGVVAGGWVVKVARHGYGYLNPTRVVVRGKEIVASLPAARGMGIPGRGEEVLRGFLRERIPWLGEREFCGTRICWYADTPSGDFLIDYHPGYEGLFLATGGSGHGFKFLPVLGDRIVESIEGVLEEELRRLWRWRESAVLPFRGTEDGSRGGEKGLLLRDEVGRSRL